MFAAAIGYSFDLKTLSIISKQDYQKTAAHIVVALKENILYPLSESYKKTTLMSENAILAHSLELSEAMVFNFAHDRIQQAAYDLIPQDQKKMLHLSIGRLLMKGKNKFDHTDDLRAFLHHFNYALPLITNKKEKHLIAKYNLIVGQKSKRATAYQIALNYLQAGAVLLANDKAKVEYLT